MTTVIEISSPSINHEDLIVEVQSYSQALKKWVTIDERHLTNGESMRPYVYGPGTKKGGQRIIIRELPKAKK